MQPKTCTLYDNAANVLCMVSEWCTLIIIIITLFKLNTHPKNLMYTPRIRYNCLAPSNSNKKLVRSSLHLGLRRGMGLLVVTLGGRLLGAVQWSEVEGHRAMVQRLLVEANTHALP